MKTHYKFGTLELAKEFIKNMETVNNYKGAKPLSIPQTIDGTKFFVRISLFSKKVATDEEEVDLTGQNIMNV